MTVLDEGGFGAGRAHVQAVVDPHHLEYTTWWVNKGLPNMFFS